MLNAGWPPLHDPVSQQITSRIGQPRSHYASLSVSSNKASSYQSPGFCHQIPTMRVAFRPALRRATGTQLTRAACIGNFPARMSTAAAAQTVSSPANPASDELLDSERRQRSRQILQNAVAATAPRHDWTRDEISAIFYQPLMELAYQAVRIPTFNQSAYHR